MKEITVLAFGVVAEIIGQEKVAVDDICNTDELKAKLEANYPALKNIRYAIAVNKKMIAASTPLDADTTVALLPPFSGG